MVSVCLGLLAVLGPLPGPRQPVSQASQAATAVGIDADPAGNTATSLGEIDACVSVGVDQTFDVDVFVADVSDLAGWEGQFTYDPSVLAVAGVNPELFLAAVEGSQVIDLSTEPEPGIYKFAVGDLSTSVGESGSGVLVRVSLRAVAEGASPLALESVVLANSEAKAIGSVSGDDVFDGTVSSAQMWVGEPCPSTLPTLTPYVPPITTPEATPTPGPTSPTPGAPTPASPGPEATATAELPVQSLQPDDGDGFPWAVVGAASAAVVALLAGGLTLRWLLRRRAT